ncbi:hypothetical protein CTI14_70665, partial [Methylobacterium radiotolerans]
MQGRVTASPVISAGLVFLASEDGELVALDAHTGAPRWCAPPAGPRDGQPGHQRGPGVPGLRGRGTGRAGRA